MSLRTKVAVCNPYSFDRKQMRIAVSFLLAYVLISVTTHFSAAQPPEWEVMRVFILDGPGKVDLIPSDYLPMKEDQLQTRLRMEEKRRADTKASAANLSQAVYLAVLNDGKLLSDFSTWTLDGTQTGQIAELKNTSLAIKRARAITPGQRQLADFQSFSTHGGTYLRYDPESPTYWFGFEAKARRDPQGYRFDMTLPASANATMLIAAPKDQILSSASVVVEQADALHPHLPANWKAVSDSLPIPGDEMQWWLVHCSALERFEILVGSDQGLPEPSYAYSIPSAETSYFCTRGSVRFSTTLKIDPSSSPKLLSLRASKGIRIQSIATGTSAVGWKITDSASSDFTLLQLTARADELTETTLKINGLLATTADGSRTLPEIQLLNSYTANGLTTIEAVSGLVLHNIKAGGTSTSVNSVSSSDGGANRDEFSPAQISSPTLNEPSSIAESQLELDDALDTTDAGIPFPSNQSTSAERWQVKWHGLAPKITLDCDLEEKRMKVESLTKFDIRSEWLAATYRGRFKLQASSSNEMTLQIGTGWFVDDVRILGSSATDIQEMIRESPNHGNSAIEVKWKNNPTSVAFDIEVVAHRPKQTNENTVSLGSKSLITVQGADQIDNYVIEPSGRFKVQVNAVLLRAQKQPSDLPQWQQDLLSGSSRWIFRGNRGSVPPVSLIAYSGTFVANITTVLDDADGPPTAHTSVKFQPISAAVDQVQVVLPKSSATEDARWSFSRANAEAASSTPILVSTMAELTSGAILLTMDLPQPMNEAFIIRTETKVQSSPQHPIQIPVAAVPMATAGSSLLLIPKRYGIPDDSPRMELLPAELCCNDNEIPQSLAAWDQEKLSSSLAARLDPSESYSIELPSPAESASAEAWAWFQNTTHSILSNGDIQHHTTWILESPNDELLSIRVPVTWSIESLLVDHNSIDIPVRRNGTLEVLLPQGRRTQLALTCRSRSAALGWIESVKLEQCRLSIPVHDHQEQIETPPAHVPLIQLSPHPAHKILADRLDPSNLWSWLAPSLSKGSPAPITNRLDSFVPNANRGPGWTTLQLSEAGKSKASEGQDASKTVWLADRTALAGLALASVIFVIAMLRLCSLYLSCSWWISPLVAAILVVLVPAKLLPVAQLLFLGACCAALFRLALPIFHYRGHSTSNLRKNSRSAAAGVKASVWIAVCSIPFNALAQPLRSPESLRRDLAENSEIFGVVIPVDEEFQFSGPYVYVPNKLWELLDEQLEDDAYSVDSEILSAEYRMRFVRGLVQGTSRLQETTLKLEIKCSRADHTISIPFDSTELTLLGGRIDGMELPLGERLTQHSALNSVDCQFLSPGVYTLELRFNALSFQLEGDNRSVQFSVPPIPNATLRILSDGQQEISVDSIGPIQNSMSGKVARIGPVERIKVSWPRTLPRSAVDQSSFQDLSETWVHASGSSVAAACTIVLRDRPSGQFRLLCDSNWMPVGTIWGDAILTDEPAENLASETAYTLRLRTNATSPPTSSPTIQVTFAPVNVAASQSLPLPFLRSDSNVLTQRVFGWTNDPNAIWEPEQRIRNWQAATPTSTPLWPVPAQSAQPQQRLRVPPIDSANLVRTDVIDQSKICVEETSVHLALGTMKTRYVLSCPPSEVNERPIELLVPSTSRIVSLVVNGTPTENYRTVRTSGAKLIFVGTDELPGRARTLELEFDSRLRLNLPAALPRVLVRDRSISKSRYRIFRAVALSCNLQSDELSFLETNIPPSLLLQRLEAPVAEVELGASHRDSIYLPALATLSRPSSSSEFSTILRLSQSESGWNANLSALWSGVTTPLDMVCLQIPASLRDQIQYGPLVRRIVPTGDSNRVSVCLLPPPPIDQTVSVQLAFPIQDSPANQSLAIPEVSVLAANSQQRVVALPKRVDGERVQWLKVGPRKGGDWTSNVSEELSNSHNFYQLNPGQTSVVWKRIDTDAPSAQVLYQRFAITGHQPQSISGIADFWINPNHETNINFNLPPSSQIVGIESGGKPVSWSKRKDQVSVVCQPNYLTFNIRLLLRWNITDDDAFSLSLPTLDASQSKTVKKLVHVDLRGHTLANSDSLMTVVDPLADTWADMVNNSVQTLSTLSGQEVENWLKSWHPHAIGLSPSTPITLSFGAEQQDSLDMTVSSYWDQVCAQLGTDPSEVDIIQPTHQQLPTFQLDRLSGRKLGSLLVVPSNSIEIISIPNQAPLTPRLVAATLLGLVSLLVAIVIRRTSSSVTQFIASSPWAYWMILAVATWMLLPVWWPSSILLALSLMLMFTQFGDFRRLQRTSNRS